MIEKKLTKEQIEKLAKQQLKLRESQAAAQARRRAKLKEQGKTQITLTVSADRAAQVKDIIKLIEQNNYEEFCLGALGAHKPGEWGVVWNSLNGVS